MPEINDADVRLLRRAIELSTVATANGNRPFGAVIGSASGELLAEAANSNRQTGDCTAHAEIMALREAAAKGLSREVLAQATMYAYGEPCVMCAGGIFWSGIGRVVFGIDAVRMRAFRQLDSVAGDLEWSCQEIYARSPRPIEVHGSLLLEEATAPHASYWAQFQACEPKVVMSPLNRPPFRGRHELR